MNSFSLKITLVQGLQKTVFLLVNNGVPKVKPLQPFSNQCLFCNLQDAETQKHNFHNKDPMMFYFRTYAQLLVPSIHINQNKHHQFQFDVTMTLYRPTLKRQKIAKFVFDHTNSRNIRFSPDLWQNFLELMVKYKENVIGWLIRDSRVNTTLLILQKQR